MRLEHRCELHPYCCVISIICLRFLLVSIIHHQGCQVSVKEKEKLTNWLTMSQKKHTKIPDTNLKSLDFFFSLSLFYFYSHSLHKKQFHLSVIYLKAELVLCMADTLSALHLYFPFKCHSIWFGEMDWILFWILTLKLKTIFKLNLKKKPTWLAVSTSALF